MGKEKIDITKISECPHCGGKMGYYQKWRYKGYSEDNTLFVTGEKYNTGMWEGATNTWQSAWYYCMECRKKICRAK